MKGASFFKLEKTEQKQIADLAEAFRQGCLGDKQADLWSCGEMAHMIGTRVNKYNSSSNEKEAVLGERINFEFYLTFFWNKIESEKSFVSNGTTDRR